MARRDNPAQTYLSDEELDRVDLFAEEHGESRSDALRLLILDGLKNRDTPELAQRLSAVEGQLAELADAVSEPTTHTHKQTKGSETVEKTRAIAERLQTNHDAPVIDQSDVERAIKDIAGGDPRTLEKYKDELTERELLYRHPNDDVPSWFLDRDMWLDKVATHARQYRDPRRELSNVLSEYGLAVGDIRNESEQIAEVVKK